MTSGKPGVNPASLSGRTGRTSGSHGTVPPVDDDTTADMPPVAAQLRRRREASRREPALPFEERRDPLDPAPGDRRRSITCTLSRHSAVFTGPAGPISTAIRVAGVPSMRVVRDPDSIAVPLAHADDVLSQLRYGLNIVVWVVDGTTTVVE